MAITKTALINKALTLLGATPITNIDDDTKTARSVRAIYELSLRAVLSECLWRFATKRRLLNISTAELEWYYTGESYVYQKPADCVRIFGTNDDKAKWREEGDYIVSDTSGLGIVYTYYLDEPTKFNASFANAFIDRLCSDVAFMLLNSKTVAETYNAKYEAISLPKAEAENSQTGTQQSTQDDAWENAKYGDTNPEA